MNIVLVDDEQRALNLLKIIVEKYPDLSSEDSIQTFSDSVTALSYILANDVDLIFIDIEMPRLTGIEVSQQILLNKGRLPELVFVTAYPQYAMDAWQMEALGYILKPYEADQIYRMIAKAKKLQQPSKIITGRPSIFIKCFPDFDLLVDGSPINFNHRKSKELLAVLVHCQGNWVTIDKLAFYLLENAEEKSAKNYIRTIIYRLRQILEKYNIADMIVPDYGKVRLITDDIKCDYYEYLRGNRSLYHGSYMSEYSWAEEENANMWFHHDH